MSLIGSISTALVVAPHPDDEVLGCGGTIARLAQAGAKVVVAIVTRGQPPLFDPALIARGREEARKAHAVLGVAECRFLEFPAAMVDTIAHSQVNESLSVLVREVAPDTVFLPFAGDLHLDHQLIFLSGLVASRPNREQYPRRLLAYETLSETNWNAPYLSPPFAPNLYIDIGDMLERKLEAMACYASQLRPAPNERSIEALRALARLRGAAVHRHAAEAFVLLREVG